MSQRLDFYHLLKDQKQLTTRDLDLIKTMKTLLTFEHSSTFSSDTFRRFGFDRYFPDKAHGVGGWFARLKANKKAVEVGEIRSTFPSNHGRKIRVYAFVEKDGEIEK
jgi:hypothetical protein